MAAYPEIQDQAIEEINRIWPDCHERFHSSTTMDDYVKFPFVLACYSETLRLFPPVQMIPKIAAEDTRIVLERSNESSLASDSPMNLSQSKIAPVLTEKTPLYPSPTPAADNLVDFVVKKGTIIFVDPPGVRKCHLYRICLILLTFGS